MRLVVISDTHGFHRGMRLPKGDVLVYCGDFSRDYGSWTDTLRFAAWMGQQPHEHKLLCPGNHDYSIHEHPTKAVTLFREAGVSLLGQNPVKINGVVFDGGPWMPVSGHDPAWGFELEKRELERTWGRIQNVDVLVTHVPPAAILDKSAFGKHVGCEVLRRKVFELQPTLHCFGHVHERRGILQKQGITFMNAASNTRGTFVRDDVHGITHMTMAVRDAFTFDLTARGES